MKSAIAILATVFAVSAFAQAPAKKEEPKKESAKPSAPTKVEVAKPTAPAKKVEAKK